MHNIVVFVDENIHLLGEVLAPYAEVISYKGRDLVNDDLKKSGCSILFIRSQTRINEDLLAGSAVRLVGTATSGTDHVDSEYLSSAGIEFISAPGSNANSVAEYVVYAALKWIDISSRNTSKQTAGVIGYGHIGKLAARYFNQMGMQVLINDPPLLEAGFYFPAEFIYSSKGEILSKADIVTNHVPLTHEGKHATLNLIDDSGINSIKEGSLFVHSSRGKVVNEAALKHRVLSGELYAAVDVWQNEPEFDTELADRSILATPHIAGYSFEGKIRGSKILAEAFAHRTKIDVDMSLIDEALSMYLNREIEKFDDLNALRHKLKHSRKLDEDTLELRELHLESIKLRHRGFDLLRKNYPKRHETI